jgi:GLPGLI family protein
MKHIRWAFTMVFITASLFSNAQKTISEGTLTYDIKIQPLNKDAGAGSLSGATETIYLKGGLSRRDMASTLGNEKTIHDSKSGNAVILKEYSGQKLMITLTKQNWDERNKRNDGVIFNSSADTKEILGYQCVKATAALKDGSTMTVYYTKDLNLINKEYNVLFKNLDGLPMQYELETKKLKFTYTITKIDLNSLPVARFEFPKSGYRVMTYEENQAGKKDI